MANARRRPIFIEEVLGIASKGLYNQSPEDGKLAMLRNLHGTSHYLRTHRDLIDMRTPLMQARLAFAEMTASIAEMLHRQLETPLGDTTVLDHFMTHGAGQNCSRLRVLKDLFNRAERMPLSRIYTPSLVKLMHTAEYIHDTLAPRDFTLLATEMRIMAPCVD